MDDNERIIIKDEVSEIITNTQKTIDEFEQKIKTKKTELGDIKKIQDELRKAIQQLDSIKKVLDAITLLYDQLGGILKVQQKELKDINYELIKKQKGQLIELIRDNLPDAMVLEDEFKGIWKLVIQINEKNELIERSKKSSQAITSKNEVLPVGEIVLKEENSELVLKIKIQGEELFQEFKIDNCMKVYPIISHIITKYNYKKKSNDN